MSVNLPFFDEMNTSSLKKLEKPLQHHPNMGVISYIFANISSNRYVYVSYTIRGLQHNHKAV